jgi:hypothetical protein
VLRACWRFSRAATWMRKSSNRASAMCIVERVPNQGSLLLRRGQCWAKPWTHRAAPVRAVGLPRHIPIDAPDRGAACLKVRASFLPWTKSIQGPRTGTLVRRLVRAKDDIATWFQRPKQIDCRSDSETPSTTVLPLGTSGHACHFLVGHGGGPIHSSGQLVNWDHLSAATAIQVVGPPAH